MSQANPVSVGMPSFEAMLTPVMNELQSSLAALVDALPDSIRRAVDLERSLRLEKKLAWQVFRLSRSSSLKEVGNVPSLVSLGRVIDAARKKRVARPVIDRVQSAFERFDDFAEVHCGDRMGLISMVSGLTHQKSDLYELKTRKAYFQAASHIWGLQGRMQVRSSIYLVEPRPEQRHHTLFVSSDFDLQRLRENDPLVIAKYMKGHADPRDADAPTSPAAIAETTRSLDHSLALLPEFCSQPLPKMTTVVEPDQLSETTLIIPPGRTGAVTLCSMQLHENIARGPQSRYAAGSFLVQPIESLVTEVLVPEGLSDPATARAAVYGRRTHPEHIFQERAADLMPQRETVFHLGTMDSIPPVDGAPRYEEAVRTALKNCGWLGMRFDVYRCRVEYPVLHSLVTVAVDAGRT